MLWRDFICSVVPVSVSPARPQYASGKKNRKCSRDKGAAGKEAAGGGRLRKDVCPGGGLWKYVWGTDDSTAEMCAAVLSGTAASDTGGKTQEYYAKSFFQKFPVADFGTMCYDTKGEK